MSDVFREVNEDLRREQLKQLWKRYGIYLIGAAVLIVVVVAGSQILQSMEQSRSAESGDRYQAALDLYLDGDLVAAEAAFVELVEDGYGGYPTIALMAAAAVRAELGDTEGAIAAFERVANDNGADQELRNVALIRAALLLADTETPEQILERVSPFLEVGSPYRALALEALAVAAINTEEYDRALAWVIDMTEDPYVQNNNAVLTRASILFTYITARQAELAPPEIPAVPAGELPAAPAGAFPGFAAPGAETPVETPAVAPDVGPLQFQLPGLGTPLTPFVPPAGTPAGEAPADGAPAGPEPAPAE